MPVVQSQEVQGAKSLQDEAPQARPSVPINAEVRMTDVASTRRALHASPWRAQAEAKPVAGEKREYTYTHMHIVKSVPKDDKPVGCIAILRDSVSFFVR